MKENLAIFENFRIRRVYDEKAETWYFSVVDIIQVLTQQSDFQSAWNYWKVLKNRLAKEGSQSVTNCNQLKLEATDGKKYRTDGPVGDPSDHSNFKFRRYCPGVMPISRRNIATKALGLSYPLANAA